MGHGGNVIAELTADHREVDELFAQLEARAAADPERRGLADRLTIELVRHGIAEEEYLYPAVRRYVDDGDDFADQEIAEHRAVERLLKELEGCAPGDGRFDAVLSQLKASVTEHVSDEENRLFPLLADACPAATLDELGEKIRTAKKTAPARPHPAAQDTVPLDPTLAPGAGLVDRARDMVTGRGRQG